MKTAHEPVNESLASKRERILGGDNRHCFIERERILRAIAPEAPPLDGGCRYAFVLDRLLAEISTPVEPDDVFLGRMLEGALPEEEAKHPTPPGWGSLGHLTLDWPSLLGKGLGAIAAEARENAASIGTNEAENFARNATSCAEAIAAFARRYAAAARMIATASHSASKGHLLRAADALDKVPAGPACYFFSALQSMWLVHLVTSCVVGARDFALGRMDQYLLPYYMRDIAEGVLTRQEAVELLAHFLMKTNEITGTATWNHQPKPIPSQASKQYLVLGGRSPEGRELFNDLSLAILEAAELVGMPEPVLTIRMDTDSSPLIKKAAARAAVRLGSQVHFYNDAVIVPELIRRGADPADAHGYSMVGCCRVDLPGKMDSGLMLTYQYHNCVEWLMNALDKEADSFDSIIRNVQAVAADQLRAAAEKALSQLDAQPVDQFHFESLLLAGCVERCRDCHAGGAEYHPQGHFLGGIATVVDSLAAIRRLVFEERRMSLAELMRIVKSDFTGHEPLRIELKHGMPKFGNGDSEADTLARQVGEVLVTALDAIQLPPQHLLFSGFYSLDSHHRWGRELPSTPDGRVRGEPVSENQSPVYGADAGGVTALLRSVASLPLDRTVMGGLNVKFGGRVPEADIAALIETFFKMSGLHLGFTFVNRQTLLDAKAHPDQHRSLCVRLYGFSEFFVALSPDEQEELVNRTEVG